MHRAFVLPPILLLAACASAQDYPSLERRPAERGAPERMTGSAEPVAPQTAPAPPQAPSPELATRLDQLVGTARAAHQRFLARRAGAERAVAAGGGDALGSEGWASATVALSDLESARSDAMVSLAELDQLYTADLIASTQTGDQTRVTAIAAARDQVTALVGEEDAALSQLRGRMRD